MDIQRQFELIGSQFLEGQKQLTYKRERKATNFIKQLLPSLKRKVVLDIGCGGGDDILYFESLGASEVFGIDSSEYMLNQAKTRVKDPQNLKVRDMDHTGFNDGFFDVIVGRFSFHYLKDFDNGYQELGRILKPNGVLILVVHHPFRDLMKQKDRTYGKQEIVQLEIYKNKVPIRFPTHTLGEYFSSTFFKYFYMDQFFEEEKPQEFVDEFKTPGIMAFRAVRR